jgi:hypothetical protein
MSAGHYSDAGPFWKAFLILISEGLIPRSWLRGLTLNRQPLFSRDDSLLRSTVKAKQESLFLDCTDFHRF